MTDEVEDKPQNWHRLSPELKLNIVCMAIDDDAWHSLRMISKLEATSKEMRGLVNTFAGPRLHKVNLDAAKYISDKVFASAYPDENLLSNWPYAAEQLREISLSSQLRAMMPLLETRSPEQRTRLFQSVAENPSDVFRMAGYAEFMTRPKLFDENQRMKMLRETIAVFVGSEQHAPYFAGRVLANGFLAFGGKDPDLIYRMIASSDPISRHFVEGASESNPSLFARLDVRSLAQKHLTSVGHGEQSTILLAIATYNETPSPEEREFIFNNALNLLEKRDLHEYPSKLAAQAVLTIARNDLDGIPDKFESRIDRIKATNTEAGRRLENALSKIDQPKPVKNLRKMHSEEQIKAAYFDIIRNIDKSIATHSRSAEELYEIMEKISHEAKIAEVHMNSSRKSLIESREPRENDVTR